VANTIGKIDLQRLRWSIPSPRRRPRLHRGSPGGKQLLVTSRWAGKLTLIDTETKRS
jgi:hypothetical protein